MIIVRKKTSHRVLKDGVLKIWTSLIKDDEDLHLWDGVDWSNEWRRSDSVPIRSEVNKKSGEKVSKVEDRKELCTLKTCQITTRLLDNENWRIKTNKCKRHLM